MDIRANRRSLEDIIRNLEERIDLAGFDQKSNRVSGMKTTQIARTVTDVTFQITPALSSETFVTRQADFDRFIFGAHGSKGLNFVRVEGKEWFQCLYHNPGEAWKEDRERWEGLLNPEGEMGYTYNERLERFNQYKSALLALHMNEGTRQAYISIYEPKDSTRIGSNIATPCVIGYQFTRHAGRLDLSVLMRSADITNCLRNDIWLANNLLVRSVSKLNEKAKDNINIGDITFHIVNLHRYPAIKPKGE